jgi:tRNA threonylcarbamoyladenosine biosynthesis protein TsaB
MAAGEPQPFVLALDSAGSGCSAAVAVGDTVLASEGIAGLHGQAEALMPIVDAVMRRAGVPPAGLDWVATTIGPGSFTGIRVGLAAARGIALAAGARLLGVTSFEAVAAALPRGSDLSCFLLVALESRREDLFIQLFDCALNLLGEPAAVLPNELGAAVNAVIGGAPLLILGDAACRAAPLLAARPDTAHVEGSAPIAVGVLRAALRRGRLGEPGTAARPLYLRPPGVTLPKVRPQ